MKTLNKNYQHLLVYPVNYYAWCIQRWIRLSRGDFSELRDRTGWWLFFTLLLSHSIRKFDLGYTGKLSDAENVVGKRADATKLQNTFWQYKKKIIKHIRMSCAARVMKIKLASLIRTVYFQPKNKDWRKRNHTIIILNTVMDSKMYWRKRLYKTVFPDMVLRAEPLDMVKH